MKPQRIVMLYNPRASRIAGNVASAHDLLARGARVVLCETPADATASADVLRQISGADLVVVAGGDGTLHRQLPMLLQARRPVAVLPLGTANDFARTLGLPLGLADACRTALDGSLAPVDIGFVDDIPFVNVASIGLAAKVTRLQSSERKRFWRIASYGLTLLDAVRRVKPFRCEIRTDNGSIRGLFLQASIGNGRFHGGGLMASPDATIDDGLLHVYAISARRWYALIPVLPALAFGLHGWTRSVKTLAAAGIELRTRSPRTITADGEIVGTTTRPVTFRVQRSALLVKHPQFDKRPHQSAVR